MDAAFRDMLLEGETDPDRIEELDRECNLLESMTKHNRDLDAIWDLSSDGIDDLIKLVRPNADVDAIPQGVKAVWFHKVLTGLLDEIEEYETN